MALSDISKMPFGKFRGQKLEDVPASYLIWLYDNNKCNGELKEYIKGIYRLLEMEVENEKKGIK
jgi:uncharacterized protein (DUF3820 family)